MPNCNQAARRFHNLLSSKKYFLHDTQGVADSSSATPTILNSRKFNNLRLFVSINVLFRTLFLNQLPANFYCLAKDFEKTQKMLDLNAIVGSIRAGSGENSLRKVHMRVSVLSRLLFSLLLVALAASSLFGGVDRQSGDYSFKLSLLQEEPDGKVCVEQTYCLRIKMVDGHGEASQKVQLLISNKR